MENDVRQASERVDVQSEIVKGCKSECPKCHSNGIVLAFQDRSGLRVDEMKCAAEHHWTRIVAA